jgi:3,4-dihydroxy 2-butanone 4-phosphate synthase
MKEDVRCNAAALSSDRDGQPRVVACPDAFFAHFMRGAFHMLVNQENHPYCLSSPDLEGRIQSALAAMRAGVPVILLDDFDRENEADLIVAADKLTVETMALMIRECSGIVCLCLTADKVRELELPPMAPDNGSRYGTPFTVSIEARHGVTTGVSAADRVTTVRAATAARAKPGGVLARKGHTEGSVDLAIMAGLNPAAVLCELMNPDGTMMRGDAIERFAELHGMPILTIAEMIAWRRKTEAA